MLDPVRGHEQAGTRPVLILSNDIFNDAFGVVVSAALTSQPQRPGFPITLEIHSVKMPQRSWVKIGQIRTLSVERIGNRLGTISEQELDRVIEGLNEILS